MSDEIAEYLAKKTSKNDKRGGVRNSQDLHNDQRVLDAPSTRPVEQLREVQLKLAVLALEHPVLVWSDEREAWLAEVLECLGLRRELTAPDKAAELPCFPYSGTRRGYNMHLRGYTAACTECKNVAVDAERQRLRTMGIIREDATWTVR